MSKKAAAHRCSMAILKTSLPFNDQRSHHIETVS